MCDIIELIKKENSRASRKNMFEERKILSSENLGSFNESKNNPMSSNYNSAKPKQTSVLKVEEARPNNMFKKDGRHSRTERNLMAKFSTH